MEGGSAVARLLSPQDKTNIKNRRHTSLPLVGFETTIPVSEWRKTFRAVERAATVISKYLIKNVISVYERGLG
jgi:hypothetical protein